MMPAHATRLKVLRELLAAHHRICIVGAPRTGKTTLSSLVVDRHVVHTDRFNHHEWSEVPNRVFAECASHPRFLLEGVHGARALRRGLPIDAVLYLDEPCVDQSSGQRAMGRAIATIFSEWRARNRFVPVFSPDLPSTSQR